MAYKDPEKAKEASRLRMQKMRERRNVTPGQDVTPVLHPETVTPDDNVTPVTPKLRPKTDGMTGFVGPVPPDIPKPFSVALNPIKPAGELSESSTDTVTFAPEDMEKAIKEGRVTLTDEDMEQINKDPGYPALRKLSGELRFPKKLQAKGRLHEARKEG